MYAENLKPKKKYMSWARHVFWSTTDNVSSPRICNRWSQKNRYKFRRIPRDIEEHDFPIDICRRLRFPIRICFAKTTNNAQCQSFSEAFVLDFCYECFTYCQLYVVLSHTTHPSNMYITTERNCRPTTGIVHTSDPNALIMRIKCDAQNKWGFRRFQLPSMWVSCNILVYIHNLLPHKHCKDLQPPCSFRSSWIDSNWTRNHQM